MPRVVSETAYLRIFRRDRGECRYCGVPLFPAEATIDHFIPRSKGGCDEEWNLLLARETCNRVKDDHEFHHAWKLWDRIGMKTAAAVLATVAPFLHYETCADSIHFGVEVRWVSLPPKPCPMCKALAKVDAMGERIHGQRQALAAHHERKAKRRVVRAMRFKQGGR